MSSLVIGLCVVAVSVAFVIPALFSLRPVSYRPENATSAPVSRRGNDHPPRRSPLPATPAAASVSPLRRIGSALGLLGVVLGTAMAIAATVGLVLLIVGVALG